MQHPTLCRPAAYELFRQHLPLVHTTDGLLYAAIAISMHGLEEVSPEEIDDELHGLAHRISGRLRTDNTDAMMAHLHDVLFDEEGFRGNSDDYYDPHNSYLSEVLESKLGIPISLSLIYKVVAERVGLEVEGVNAPGHFVVRVTTDDGNMIVDPYMNGGVLTEAEAFERVETVTGRHVPRNREYLAAAKHTQWLSRMLLNLQHIFATRGQQNDLAAMSELQLLLDTPRG